MNTLVCDCIYSGFFSSAANNYEWLSFSQKKSQPYCMNMEKRSVVCGRFIQIQSVTGSCSSTHLALHLHQLLGMLAVERLRKQRIQGDAHLLLPVFFVFDLVKKTRAENRENGSEQRTKGSPLQEFYGHGGASESRTSLSISDCSLANWVSMVSGIRW